MSAEQADIRDLAADPLLLSRQPGLGLTQENQQFLIENLAREGIRNQEAFASKQIPFGWITLALLMVALAVVIKKNFVFWSAWLRRKLEKPVELQQEALIAIAEAQRDYSLLGDRLYLSLDNIIRSHLERYYHVSVRQKTNRELLEQKVFDFSSHADLIELLQNADLVKFAHYSPAQEECERAIMTAKKFVCLNSQNEKKRA